MAFESESNLRLEIGHGYFKLLIEEQKERVASSPASCSRHQRCAKRLASNSLGRQPGMYGAGVSQWFGGTGKLRTGNMSGSAKVIGLAILLALVSSAARADWRVDAETGALYDSNLSNSERASDVKDDWAWQSNLRVGDGFQLARDLRLNLGVDLREQVWARFDAFNNVAPGGTASLRYRFGLGRLAPWVLMEDRLAYAFFKEGDRSGVDNRFRIRGGFGITERLAIEAAYTFDDYEARSPFWDLSGNSGAIRLTFDVTSSLQVALGYIYRNGEVISYALPPRPDLVALSSAREPVNSFGSPPYTAYRLRGVTNALSASVGYTINKYISLQVNYEFRDTTQGPLEYVNHLVEAKVAFVY